MSPRDLACSGCGDAAVVVLAGTPYCKLHEPRTRCTGTFARHEEVPFLRQCQLVVGHDGDCGPLETPSLLEALRAMSRMQSWARMKGKPNDLGWKGIARDLEKLSAVLEPCFTHDNEIRYLTEQNKKLKSDNEMLMGALNVKESERRAHRDALQAWADKYAVAKPTGKYLKQREVALWEACSELGLRVPIVAGPGYETEAVHNHNTVGVSFSSDCPACNAKRAST